MHPVGYTAAPMGLRARAARTVEAISRRRRGARGELFRELLQPTASDRILDLGSEEGDHIAATIPFRENVTIADIDPEALARGCERHGFATALLDESGRLPFPDGHFDIVFCSSVIEHVTIPKDDLERVRSSRAFADASFARQRQFADEIRRVGRRYFVQTPNKWYPVESHTWLPLPVVLLPRELQLRTIAWTNRWWIKRTAADFHLLTAQSLAQLFPEAEIVRERTAGVTKSLIAVRR